MAGDASQGNRAPLDRETLVREALALLDEVGLDDLSMRRLADRLGVTAASLYWYVRNKDELLALLADAISGEMPFPDPALPWREALEAGARNLRRVARCHRDAARVLAATIPTGRHRLRVIDTLLGVLRHAGFPPADVVDLSYLFNAYVVGFMLDQDMGVQSSPTNLAAVDASFAVPERAHLIVERGAVNLSLRAGASLRTLYEATFVGRPPELDASGDTVRVRLRHDRSTSCLLSLSSAPLWEIHIEGGASRLAADLQGLRLASLSISGGVTRTSLRLPQPSGTVPLRIDGGAETLQVERPPAAAIRLHLRRASSRIALDGVRLGSAGGGTKWESPDYSSAQDRYDLEIGSSVSGLTISRAETEFDAGSGADAVPHSEPAGWFADQPPEEYPNLAALSSYLAHLDQDRCFDLGLGMLLDGLERRLQASSATGSAEGEEVE
jgi:AcrR family transcriptional regulator